VGLALGSGIYLVEEHDVGGLVAYGGTFKAVGGAVTVQTQDALRRRVFIGPLRVLITIYAGIISQFPYRADVAAVSLTLGQLEGGPTAVSAVVTVTTPGLGQTRQGWQVPPGSEPVSITTKHS
jgi:hypothetical protein